MYIGLHVKYLYYQTFMELEFPQHIYEKCLNIQPHEIRVVESKLFREDGRTDMKIIVALRIIANATKRIRHRGGFLHWPSR